MSYYKLISVFIVLLFIFLGARPSFALVSVTISDAPSYVDEQPFTFNVSVTGAQAGTNYLRANFFSTDTTKYFGYTYNGSAFVNSSTCYDYLPITIDSSGNWSGAVQAKIDKSSIYYSGSGTYGFKVRRYTQSCPSSYLWSNEVTITVSTPSSTSPSPSLSPSSTSPPGPSSSSSSFTISNIPSQINSDQLFSISVNLSLPNNPNTLFYLKGAFKKADSSNYFGQTLVSGNWIKNGSTYSSQLAITTDSSGNWSGDLEVQVDSEDAGFTGTGDYIFKVGRYTSAGSGPTWSNESTIKIVSVESSNQETTAVSPASNDSPSTTNPSTAPSAKSKVITSSQSKSYDRLVYHTASVAAATTSASPPNTAVRVQQSANFIIWIGAGLILTGIGLLAYIYLRGSNLHETISNLFRKRN